MSLPPSSATSPPSSTASAPTAPVPPPGSAIPIRSLPNLRDLGGWATAAGGTVRRGLVFRSMALGYLTDADLPAFDALGVRTVFDLRTDAERVATPDRVPPGVREVPLDVLADSGMSAAAVLPQAMSDPEAVRRMLADGRAEQLLADSYREMVTLASARESYRRFLLDLADATQRPALFHCTAGKDRTGWAAAILLRLLGVSDEDIRTDYLNTNEQLLPAIEPMLAGIETAGVDPELLRPVLGVRADYLDTAFEEVEQRFGDFDGYLTDGLGIDAAIREALRAGLVDP